MFCSTKYAEEYRKLCKMLDSSQWLLEMLRDSIK